MKRVFLLCLIAAVFGCSKAVDFKITKDYFSSSPRTIAVLPVKGEKANADARRLFRTMTAAKLRSRNYAVLNLEELDRKYTGIGSARFEQMSPGEVSRLLGADAVLYTEITKWKEKRLVTYASLKIGAAFELWSADGERLWEADYSTKEWDARFDKPTVELAVIKIYEPRVQRVVDSVFVTLPPGHLRVEEKRYFDWLP